jgi:hypothetical protein
MNIKLSRLTLVLLVLMVGSSVLVSAHAQVAQTSYTLNLNHFTVEFAYPSQVSPGDFVTVNMQANVKDSLSSASLATQVFYVDGGSLRQLASATVSSNEYLNSGASLSKQITFTVPQDAPRTSLTALVTETVQRTQAAYASYYYPAYYNFSNPYCYYYPHYYGYCSHGYRYYTYYPYANGYYTYPFYSYASATDSGVAPLSYIKAQTPEYVAIQSQYQAAEQQLNQTQAQNQQLQQQLQSSQNAIAQRDSTIANLNQQLSSNQNVNTTLEVAAAGLGILAILCGAFAVHYRRVSKQQRPSMPQAQQTRT